MIRAGVVLATGSVVFFLIVPGCGRLPDQAGTVIEKEDADDFTDAAVLHPSDAEVAAGDAEGAGYMVTFRTNESGAGLHFSSFYSEFAHHYSQLADSYLADDRIKDINFITAVDLSLRNDPQWKAEFQMPKVLGLVLGQSREEPVVGAVAKVTFADSSSAREVLAEWEAEGRIWFAEPNGYSRLFQATDLFGKHGESYTQAAGAFTHIAAIKAAEGFKALSARDQATTATDAEILEAPPVIAVLDSGVDYEHIGLKKNMWTNDQPGASGCKDDVHGCNTVRARKGVLGDGEVWPIGADGPGMACQPEGSRCDHGTHVAGLVAGDVSAGFAGTCPVCQVMAVRVVDMVNGEARVSDEAQITGMKYIMYFTRGGSNVVRVVNSSFGKYSRSRTVALIISILRRTGKGTVVIAAAGNEDSMSRTYPAGLTDTIAVAAVDNDGNKTKFSNFGIWVDVSAPGLGLYSTFPGSTQPSPNSGTSMSAPVVAGVAGVVLAANPGISFSGLRSAIVNTADYSIYAADKGGTETPGFNYRNYYIKVPGESAPRPLLGSGLVNVEAAVTGKQSTAFVSPPLDRVTPNCAVVATAHKNGILWPQLLMAMILLVPLFGAGLRAILSSRSHAEQDSL